MACHVTIQKRFDDNHLKFRSSNNHNTIIIMVIIIAKVEDMKALILSGEPSIGLNLNHQFFQIWQYFSGFLFGHITQYVITFLPF